MEILLEVIPDLGLGGSGRDPNLRDASAILGQPNKPDSSGTDYRPPLLGDLDV